MDFWRFWAATYISKANYVEIARGRRGQPAKNFCH